MSPSSISVIGSANVDLIMKMDRLPRVGESVPDALFVQTFGGKGANQAVAAARSGAGVLFVGCVGDDIYGASDIENLRRDGIDVSYTFVEPGVASGVALIMIGPSGENYLGVAPGANYRLLPGHVDRAWEKIAQSSMVMLQAEIPLDTVAHAIRRAAAAGIEIMFNVAPARRLDDIALDKIAYILVNETEALLPHRPACRRRSPGLAGGCRLAVARAAYCYSDHGRPRLPGLGAGAAAAPACLQSPGG